MDPVFLGFSGSARSPRSQYLAQIELNLALMGASPGLGSRGRQALKGRKQLRPSGLYRALPLFPGLRPVTIRAVA